MKVAGASTLQELFVSTHRDAERVDHLISIVLCSGDDVLVLPVELLDRFLKDREPKTNVRMTFCSSVH